MAVDINALTGLREGLARLYGTVDESRRIIEQAGLDPITVGFDTNARQNWFNILSEANKHDRQIDRIVDEALKEYDTNITLMQWKAGTVPPPVVEGPSPGAWQGPQSPLQLEKLMGPVSSLVPISYLEQGLVKSRSVALVRLGAEGGSGSGFLTAGDILITNHHVLPDAETARSAVALFNFQANLNGLPLSADEHALLPDELFKTSEADDWSAVKVAGDPATAWGILGLDPAAAARIKAGDRVNVIQHPNGELKKISFFSNVVVYAGGGAIQYLTDTEPGSSGSPVFDRDWNVVALHHSGGWIIEPGATDKTKKYYRNEGIAIDRVIAGLG